jgi:hypothetical protein
MRREILRDLKTDSFVGPGDQGDGFVLHSNLFLHSICGQHRRPVLKRVNGTAFHLIRNDVPLVKR